MSVEPREALLSAGGCSRRAANACLTVAILFGFVLRIHGIDWGTAADTGEFQAFHPDERTLVENVRWVGEDLRRVEMPYGLFPAYMLWGASRLSGISVRPETNAEKRRLYVLARALTVLLATVTMP